MRHASKKCVDYPACTINVVRVRLYAQVKLRAQVRFHVQVTLQVHVRLCVGIKLRIQSVHIRNVQ